MRFSMGERNLHLNIALCVELGDRNTKRMLFLGQFLNTSSFKYENKLSPITTLGSLFFFAHGKTILLNQFSNVAESNHPDFVRL